MTRERPWGLQNAAKAGVFPRLSGSKVTALSVWTQAKRWNAPGLSFVLLRRDLDTKSA